jgi:hypothetical protein
MHGVNGFALEMRNPWPSKSHAKQPLSAHSLASTKRIGSLASITASVAMPSCLIQVPNLMQAAAGPLFINQPIKMQCFKK